MLVQVREDLLIEASKSPEVSLFQRLHQHWDHLPHSDIEFSILSVKGHSRKGKASIQQCMEETRDPGGQNRLQQG